MRTQTLKTHSLGFGIVSRMLAWGAASGAVLGGLFPFVAVLLIQLLKLLFGTDAGSANWTMLNIWMGVGFFAGWALGGIAGLILGLFVGTVLAVLTYKFFNPVADFRRYRIVVQLVCLLVGAPAALLLDLLSGLPRWDGWGAEWAWLVWGLTPTLIATTAIWLAGRYSANWVVATVSRGS